MRIGFNPVYVKCYCRGCYHIFMTSYNSCKTYIGGDDRCPYCGTNEKVVREDCLSPVFNGMLEMRQKEEQEELKRIKQLLETHDVGWYPPEDYS